jgi:hypothetical protein
MTPLLRRAVLAALASAALAGHARAAETEAGGDTGIDAAEPDVSVIALPSTLSIPPGGLVFRVTHRFTRPLSDGSIGDLAQDLFGFDSSSSVGLELRVGVMRGLQAGVYRLSDRTIDVFAQQTLMRQGGKPFSAAVQASVEGLDNFQEDHSPRVALLLSRKLGEKGAFYVEPGWVGNANLSPPSPGAEDSSFVLGLGLRYNLGESYSVVAEAQPVIAGYKGIKTGGGDSAPHLAFAFERHVGGHVFQINFSNSTNTTPAGVARAQDNRVADWYIGFNLSRKFY